MHFKMALQYYAKYCQYMDPSMPTSMVLGAKLANEMEVRNVSPIVNHVQCFFFFFFFFFLEMFPPPLQMLTPIVIYIFSSCGLYFSNLYVCISMLICRGSKTNALSKLFLLPIRI